jgi:hypothetical protein
MNASRIVRRARYPNVSSEMLFSRLGSIVPSFGLMAKSTVQWKP